VLIVNHVLINMTCPPAVLFFAVTRALNCERNQRTDRTYKLSE